jgi:alkylation response protein AidB-like acyl-CoA dehydrogenase
MAIDLRFTPEQEHLRGAARDYFQRNCPTTVVREVEDGETGFVPGMWAEMARLGWLGIAVPETYGGSGGGFLDLFPLYEELGRALVPSPHLDTAVIAVETLLAAGSDAQRDELLPAIVEGRCIVSLALLEANGGFGRSSVTLPATAQGDDFVLDGTKLLVPFAPSADRLLCAARTGTGTSSEGVTLFLVDPGAPGVTLSRLRTIDGGPLFAVELAGVTVSAADVVGDVGRGWEPLAQAMTKAAVLQTATIVGAGHAVLDMTNQYAKDREQFGNPIGRYQAVQYMVTDVLIDMHRADLLARQAAYRIDAGKPFAREAAIAVAFGKEAAAHLHRQAHEVHAGVAFILDHDLQLYSRRSKFWENNLGDARYHHDQLARELQLV